MSDEENKTRATTGVKFSAFKQVGPQEGNPVQVVGLRDGENVRANLTTDLVETNPDITFRNSKGQFAAVDPGVSALTNQLKVNRYFYERLAEMGVPIGEDPPSETPQDGAFWFDNSEDVMQLFMWHQESDAWLPIAPPTTLEGRVATGEATQQAIIEQIQESLVEQQQIKNKVAALEGAVGEHSFVFDGVSQNPRAGEFILKTPGNQNTNYLSEGGIIAFSETDREDFPVDWSKINTGDVIRISSVDKQVAEIRITAKAATSAFIYEYLGGDLDRLSELPYDCLLMSAFDPAGLATIQYVDSRTDSKIGRSAIWTLGDSQYWELRQNDTSGKEQKFIKIWDGEMSLPNVVTPTDDADAANKAYVDQEIAKAIASLPSSKPRPAQLSWLYSSMTTGAPSTGAFMFTGTNWRFSLKTWNGSVEDGFWITETAERSWNTSHLCEMSIWMKDGMQWKMVKHVELEKVYWPTKTNGKSYISFTQKWQSNDTTLKNNTEYFVTVGGFF